MIRITRNAWDQVGNSNRTLTNHAFNNRQTIHPVKGPQLAPTFEPPAGGGGNVQMAQITQATSGGNVAPGATVDVDLVDIDKVATGGTTQATNVTTTTLLVDSYVYVIDEPTGGRTMYPLELARCNLVQPQPTISA